MTPEPEFGHDRGVHGRRAQAYPEPVHDRFYGFAERFLTDESSRPLVIEPWQREILTDCFAGTRELVVLVSKRNGKTSLFAALPCGT